MLLCLSLSLSLSLSIFHSFALSHAPESFSVANQYFISFVTENGLIICKLNRCAV